ncbi:hypothetical protein pEaSNUABM28_00326 [Erwinia phage pEa_SNUABM_28]|uniref:Uncharacterized protein n=1 Tax=Erwinia phage pEa_SNUABM_16 TaxID=2869544 RepID=A0AAE9BV61_9CAUD|nr:hypothetical protein MPK64_gp324 [Erwinia phage pEa_SNUABM_16]QZE58883.1 hypothetical protein pEaSNUABM28_00326 [Erwinia phage pEa_SNUABM_28]UAW96468.1 hypothetical protein pEaSNUABM16_00324 [Erwinia phage pEa_SNUABM_16]
MNKSKRDAEDPDIAKMRKRLVDAKIIKPEAAVKLSSNDIVKLYTYYSV